MFAVDCNDELLVALQPEGVGVCVLVQEADAVALQVLGLDCGLALLGAYGLEEKDEEQRGEEHFIL